MRRQGPTNAKTYCRSHQQPELVADVFLLESAEGETMEQSEG